MFLIGESDTIIVVVIVVAAANLFFAVSGLKMNSLKLIVGDHKIPF